MYRIAVVCFMLEIGFTASAQSVNISGTVSNKSGKAISGAIVTLPGKKLTTETDANGAYSIISTSQINPVPILPSVENISLNNGIVSISLTKPAPVRIELFDMRGNLLEQVLDYPASAGEYRFDVMSHPLAANMMVIRVALGQSSSAFRYLPY